MVTRSSFNVNQAVNLAIPSFSVQLLDYRVSFSVQLLDYRVEVNGDISVTIMGNEVHISDITITPVSLSFVMNPDIFFWRGGLDIYFICVDGTESRFYWTNMSNTPLDGGLGIMGWHVDFGTGGEGRRSSVTLRGDAINVPAVSMIRINGITIGV